MKLSVSLTLILGDGLRQRQLVRLVSLNEVQPVLVSYNNICDNCPVRLNSLLELAILYLN